MAGKKRKPSDCEPIANIIGKVLQKCHGGEGQNARAVWDLWDGVVGETLARNAQPAAFKQRILMVHVSSSVWMQELHFLKKEMIKQLNQAAGARIVEDIQFKIGALPTK
jgi:predicted nucleic acid-binding Zn ribbon protein